VLDQYCFGKNIVACLWIFLSGKRWDKKGVISQLDGTFQKAQIAVSEVLG